MRRLSQVLALTSSRDCAGQTSPALVRLDRPGHDTRIHGAVTEPAFVGVGRFRCDPLLLRSQALCPNGLKMLAVPANEARRQRSNRERRPQKP